MSTIKILERTTKPERSPFVLDRDVRADTVFVVISLGVLFSLIATQPLIWAVAWFVAAFVMLTAWLIARARVKRVHVK